MVLRNGVIGDYLYINNVIQTAYKLVNYEGELYFINDGNKIAKNCSIYLSGSLKGHVYKDGTELNPGYYYFDENGRMVIK